MAVPEGWREMRLDRLADVNPESVSSSADPDTSIRYVDIATVSPGRMGSPTEMRFGDAPSRARRVVRSADTLVSTVRPYLRAAAFVEDAGQNLVASTGFAVVRARPSADARFIYQVATSDSFVAFLVERQKGGNYPAVTASDVAAAVVSVPPLPEQRKIAAILSSVDETIEKTEAVIEQLQVVKKAMMEELLTRGMPGRHTRFKQTEIGEVPEGWQVKKLAQLARVVRGSTPRPARDPRYFNGRDIPWITVTELARDDSPYLTSTQTFLTAAGGEHSRRLGKGTVVLSNSGFGLGVPKILKIDGCANDGIAAFLDLSPTVDPLFLYYWLGSRTEYLRSSVARGVEQPNLNTTLIGELQIALPTLHEQRLIVEGISAVHSGLGAERITLEAARSTKAALSAALLSGDLRVTPVEAAP